MAIVSRKIQSKIYIYKVAWLFNGNRSYAEYQVLAWVAIYPLPLVTWLAEQKWPAEQGSKASNLESTNTNVGHFPSQDSDRFWTWQVIF